MANMMQLPVGELLDERRLERLNDTVVDLVESLLPLFDDGDPNKEMDEIIEAGVVEVALKYVDPERLPLILFAWSRAVYDLYRNDREVGNFLNIAIVCGRVALERAPRDSPDHLDTHFHMCCMMAEVERIELDEAVETARKVWEHQISPHGPKSQGVLQLATTLNSRYFEFRDPSDLNEVLQLTNTFVSNHSAPRLLETRAQLHEHLYERTGMLPKIDTAIDLSAQILQLSHNDLDKAVALSDFSRRLRHRYKHMNKVPDLETSIEYARRAVQLSKNSEDIHGNCLSCLAVSLTSQYDAVGGEKIISEAIDKAQEALDLPSHRGQPTRAVWMNDLAAAYLSRYIREQESSDADQAILLARQSLDIDSKKVSQMVASYNIWYLALAKKFERRQRPQDFEAAKHVAQKLNRILPSTAADDPARGVAHLNMGWLLLCQYRKTNNRADLKEAIEATRSALSLIPKSDPSHSSAISNLGRGLMCLYEKTGLESDLKSAIRTYQDALALTPDSFNVKLERLRDLAMAYEKLYWDTNMKDNESREKALDLYINASQNLHGPPLDRIECARSAVSIYIDKKEWVEATKLAKEALKLVPFACRRYTSRDAQQTTIGRISSLASVTASLTLQAGNATEALQQLEYGRGVIFGYTIEDRGGLLALRRQYEGLARQYASLLYQVDADEIEDYRKEDLPAHLLHEWSTGLPGLLAKEWREEIARDLHRTRREALVEIEDCVDKIRQLSGYEQFQMSPSMNELTRQADEGPILVVNVSNVRADAIILTSSEIKSLQLPQRLVDEAPLFSQLTYAPTLMHAPAGSRSRKATAIEEEPGANLYSWLWEHCVKLILDELAIMGYVGPSAGQRPRVWWVGCGMASSFPFHAAGVDFGPASLENSLSQVIPSYTPTIKSLVHSRLRSSVSTNNEPENCSMDSVLLVTMPTTPGQKSLPGVDKERNAVEKACRGVYEIKELRLPDVKSVMDELDEAKIAHFACHGVSDPINPYESHLLLQKEVDGKAMIDVLTMLEVSKIAAEKHLWVAFLSACSTVQVKASQFADEGLHLASAFQVAGFAHVIGALWPANDDACARIAEEFYSEIANHGRGVANQSVVAEALWQAVMRIRSGPDSDVSHWAPFVHIGA